MKRVDAFTLIEMLVVLVIVAIVTTFAVLAFSGRADEREIRITGENLAQMITVASQEAVIYPEILGVRFVKHGYIFYYYQQFYLNEGGWHRLAYDKLSRPNAFHSGIVVTVLNSFNQQVEQKTKNPQLLLYPSGNVSPITLKITNSQQKPVYHLIVKKNGTTHLERML